MTQQCLLPAEKHWTEKSSQLIKNLKFNAEIKIFPRESQKSV